MFQVPLQHTLSFVTCSIVLLEDSISSLEDRCKGLVHSDVQIVPSFHGLLYHNQGSTPWKYPSKHNATTTNLCMTYYTLVVQLFAWKRVQQGLTHPSTWWMMNHNSSVGQLSPTDSWSCYNVPTLNVGIDAGTWSEEAYEWDICYVVPYSIMFAELCASKNFYLDLHCIGLSVELLSEISCFTKWDRLQHPFPLIIHGCPNAMISVAGFTVIHPLCISANNSKSDNPWACSFGDTHSEPSCHHRLPSVKVLWISNLSHRIQK